MDPIIGSSLIGAAGSLLGGIFGKPKRVSAEKNSRDAIMGQAQGAREASDKYGFNPLNLLGASSAVGPSESSNYMGTAIANSALMLADGLSKRQDRIGQVAALEKSNEELRLQVRELTLRPKFGGIYAQRQAVPSLGAALGRSASNAASVAADAVAHTRSAAAQGGVGLDGKPVDPEDRHGIEIVHSHGQSTEVPIGPDLDEVVSGFVIGLNNQVKAIREYRKSHTTGPMLQPPRRDADWWRLLPPQPRNSPVYDGWQGFTRRFGPRPKSWGKRP